MEIALYLVAGLLAGVAAASAAVFVLRRKETPAGPDPEQTARIQSLEENAAELRRQIDKREQDLAETRETLRQESEKRAAAEARLEGALKNIEEQKELLNQSSEKLTQTFKSLSLDALKSNSQSFMELAHQTMEKTVEQMKGDMGKRQEEMSSLVKPLGDALKQYEEQLRRIELKRQEAYTGLEKQIESLGRTNVELKKETDNLVKALRRPEVRGKWGEFTLRRTAELAGMVQRCDFFEQVSVTEDDGRYRPDMIVRLPSDRRIVVDAKVSLDGYIDALEAKDEVARAAAMKRHAEQIKSHMRGLASKEYWRRFNNTPEFVVMFIPGESFLSAALEIDHGIIEEGFENRVILATPTTLVALLKAVAYGWRQEQLAESASKISELGKDLYDRICSFTGHMTGLGKNLGRSVDMFNKAVGSLERTVLPGARKFKELGVQTKKEIEPQDPLDKAIREIEAPEPDGG